MKSDRCEMILRCCIVLLILTFVTTVITGATVIAQQEELLEELKATEPKSALTQDEIEYLHSQTRYYTLLSIDYEALLEGRGLLEVEE